jgi:hypothetical protein
LTGSWGPAGQAARVGMVAMGGAGKAGLWELVVFGVATEVCGEFIGGVPFLKFLR